MGRKREREREREQKEDCICPCVSWWLVFLFFLLWLFLSLILLQWPVNLGSNFTLRMVQRGWGVTQSWSVAVSVSLERPEVSRNGKGRRQMWACMWVCVYWMWSFSSEKEERRTAKGTRKDLLAPLLTRSLNRLHGRKLLCVCLLCLHSQRCVLELNEQLSRINNRKAKCYLHDHCDTCMPQDKRLTHTCIQLSWVRGQWQSPLPIKGQWQVFWLSPLERYICKEGLPILIPLIF